MGMIQEFKEFAMKGNMIDLAIGVVIGGAFGKIVSSLVADIITPPLNILTKMAGAESFKTASLQTGDGTAFLNYGSFIQNIIDFLIVAFVLFLVVRAINAMKRKKEAAPAPAVTPEEILLLREIRDSLAKSSPRRTDA
jgi:large conductance mechanosensitive channel